MDEEYFDILDENGNKTGIKKLRSQVHRDGDWHKTVHIWMINQNGDVLLQRRSANKDSDPNMLTVSSAGHLTAGDESVDGAIREVKEELGIDIKKEELEFICTIKRNYRYKDHFIDNEFNDLYFLRTDLRIEDMNYQEEEISEILFVPYKEFKKMVEERNEELFGLDEEFDIIFNRFDSCFMN